MRRIGAALAATLATLVGGCGQAERLNGGGASSVYPVLLKWTRVYEFEAGVQVDYQSTGSGNGVQQTLRQTIDFGCTDVPLTDGQLELASQRGGEVLHIPLLLTAAVPAYHLPELPAGTRLAFTGEVLSDIFLGKVTRWDDPALRALNPTVPLPARPILVVFRADPSGTSAVWSEFLARRRPADWQDRGLRPGTLVGWPLAEGQGVGQKGSEGVAGMVRRLPGALGYIEHTYAQQNRLDFGTLRNRAGRDLEATPEAVTAAAESAGLPDDFRPDMTDAAGPDAYPAAGCVWAVLYRKQPPQRARLLTDFFLWATDADRGQAVARRLGHAPLPADWRERIRARVVGFRGT
jgi:phosphate transport system substrate-binding protein